MEHRCSERYSADIKVLIYKLDMPVALGRIKNGNSHGLFIESDLTDVRPLQQYGIEIMPVPSTSNSQRLKLDSIVIHSTKQGFGVELDALSKKEVMELMTMLINKKPDFHQPLASAPLVANA